MLTFSLERTVSSFMSLLNWIRIAAVADAARYSPSGPVVGEGGNTSAVGWTKSSVRR